MTTQTASHGTQTKNRKPRHARRSSRRDLYQDVTDTVIAQLEAGTVPWVQPWGRDGITAPCALRRLARRLKSLSQNRLTLPVMIAEHIVHDLSLEPDRQGAQEVGHVFIADEVAASVGSEAQTRLML